MFLTLGFSFPLHANTGRPPTKKEPSYPKSGPAESPQGVKTQSVSAPTLQYRQVVDNPEALELFEKGKELYDSGQKNEALSSFSQYAARFPQGQNIDLVWIMMGKTALSLSMFSDAELYFSKVTQLSPPSRLRGEGFLGWAQSKYSQGSRKEALQILGRIDAREVRTQEKDALFNFWSKVAEEEGKMLESVLASLKVYKDASSPDKRNLETQIEKKIRDYLNESELNFLFREYPSGYPAPVVQLRLGMIQLAKGNRDGAKSYLSSVVGAYPGTRYATQAQSLLTRVDTSQSISSQKLGLLLPQTGPLAAIGKKFQDGLNLALQKQAPQLEAVVTDPGPTAATALAAFEKLVFEERVAGVIGPFTVSQVEAVANRAGEYGVPHISLSARDPLLEKSAAIFRIGMTPDKQIRALVGYAKEKLGATRFAILFPEDSFGKEYASEYFRIVEEMGLTVTAAESYSPNQSDFITQIQNMVGTAFPGFRRTEAQDLVKSLEQRLMRAPTKKELEALRVPPIVDFDVLFLPDTFKTIGQIAPALLYADVTNVKLMGPSSWNNVNILSRAGQYLEGAIFVDFFSPERASKVTKSFLDEYQAKYNTLPDTMSGAGYDLGLTLALAYRKGNPETRDELRSYLETLGSVEGALGIYNWNSRRDALQELQVFSIRRNSFQHQGGVLLKSQ